MRFRAIFNREGGTLRTTDIEALCREAEAVFDSFGHHLTCRIVAGNEVASALKSAADDPDVEAVLIGGGDGSVSAAAAVAYHSGKPLGVLPAGTMNLFARALRVPLDLHEAIAAIAGGQVCRVDIATANGQPFVHQFGVGIHARLVRIRNTMVYGSRVGKMLASLRAIAAAAVDPPRFEVEISTADGTQRRMASGIAVSNNPLDNTPVPVAERLDSGLLGVYVVGTVSTHELLNLAVDVFTGRWRSNALVSETEVRQLTLRFPARKRGVYAVIDGELIGLEGEVILRQHNGGLKIILPSETNSTAG